MSDQTPIVVDSEAIADALAEIAASTEPEGAVAA
jgi:hypothetical protein